MVELNWWHIVGLMVPELIAGIGFVVYTRIQVAKMEEKLYAMEQAHKDSEVARLKTESEMRKDLGVLRDKLDNMNNSFADRLTSMNDNFANKLYTMNATLVEASTIVKTAYHLNEAFKTTGNNHAG